MSLSYNPNKIHPAILEHLCRLGLTSDQDLESFLYPKLSALPSPFLLKSMEKAVNLVLEAIEEKHEIIIWGDYDVDGITSTALLILFFREIGISVKYHIPDRLTEGYGLNILKLQQLAELNASQKLLITVDCGISNHQEILKAIEIGYHVIVTDHHQVPPEPLPAQAVINPKQESCNFPYKDLAGVGIAFYLAAAIRSALVINKYTFPNGYKPNMKSFLALVALGTIADIVPLTGVNRLLAKGGFEALFENEKSGIGVLLAELGINKRDLNSESISFQIAPTINAAGRLGTPLVGLELLTSTSSDISKKLASQLVKLNKKRKSLGKIDLENALTKASNSINQGLKSIVIEGDYHDGLLGITASRLVEIYDVPVIVCCKNSNDEKVIKGSARAPAGFNLFSAINSCSKFLTRYGGHQAAAGISLHSDIFSIFREEFEKAVISQLLNNKQHIKESGKNYQVLSLSEALNPVLLENLQRLEPVGEGNAKPIFIDEEAHFTSVTLFGSKKEHVRGVLRGKYQNIPAIGFNLGPKIQTLNSSNNYNLVYTHMFDNFNNSRTWKIKIEDIW